MSQTCLPHSDCGSNVGCAAWVYARSKLHTPLTDLHGQGNPQWFIVSLRLAEAAKSPSREGV